MGVGRSLSSVMAEIRSFDLEKIKVVTESLNRCREMVENANTYLKIEEKTEIRNKLQELISDPNLWDDAENAKEVNLQFGRVSDDIDVIQSLNSRISDVETLLSLAKEESDIDTFDEAVSLIHVLEKDVGELEIRSLLSGEHDESDAIVEVHGGAGGTDAQDWAEMLFRMYIRWAERRGFTYEIDEVTDGQQAGILSATFIVKGRFAYGLLSTERGVHRLVRMSPFDTAHRRHTSFAAIDVVPLIEDDSNEIEISDDDIRIDTYRSSGAGGQHVNKTDSAVRITHIPTGVVVACQNERSQHQNRLKALQILSSKLAELKRSELQQKLDNLSGPNADAAFGSQIRSYVLAPYQLVKDLRTGSETGNVVNVLDGDIDQFIEAYLHYKRSNG